MKPLFNKKEVGLVMIFFLLKKDEILRDVNEVAREFHSYFNSIARSWGITENKYIIEENITSSEKIYKAIMKFQNHPSVFTYRK